MNINKIQNNTNFKSGLTPEILKMEKIVSPQWVERQFVHKGGGWFKFKDNKAFALANFLCSGIFDNLNNMHNFSFDLVDVFQPNGFYVYDIEECNKPEKYKSEFFFVNNWTIHNFDKSGRAFIPATFFMNNKYKTLEEINALTEENKADNYIGSGHFLYYFVHEWIHALQYKITENLCKWNRADFDSALDDYDAQKFTDKEREIVADVISEYAAEKREDGEFAEAFAETWSKFICKSLNKECTGFTKDPIDELRNTPKEFRKILKKISTMTIIEPKRKPILNNRKVISYCKEWG